MIKKSIMWQYIEEEPAVLTRLMKTSEFDDLASCLGKNLKALYFVAHGSSFNAAVAVSEFFARLASVRVYAYTPANFCCNCSALHYEDRNGTVVVAISQTGTSAGVIDALQHAIELGFSTIGITNEPSAPVGTIPSWHLSLMCGKEESNAKTKGYSATLLALLRFAVSLGKVRGIISNEKVSEIEEELRGMIDLMPSISERVFAWCEETNFGKSLKNLYSLGSGMNFGTAQEGQLKLMETMCIPTMFNDIGEFSHGMHRAITGDSSLLIFKSGDQFDKLVDETFEYLKSITKHVLLVDATGKSPDSSFCVSLPSFSNTQSILLTTLVVQVLSVYAPEKMGKDPNRDAHNDFTEVAHTRVQ